MKRLGATPKSGLKPFFRRTKDRIIRMNPHPMILPIRNAFGRRLEPATPIQP